MSDLDVSVVIATFNKARYLDLTLASWCGQQYPSYELIVVDDGSTDDTSEVLRKYEAELPIRVLGERHRGRAGARNRGLAAARGSRIVFVDDDRVVPPGFLAAHACLGKSHEVVVGWQYGLMVDLHCSGDQVIPPATLAAMLRDSPQRLAQALDGAAARIIAAEDLRKGKCDIDALRLEDPWEAYLDTLTQVYGDDLTACPLAWMCGTTGNMSASREILLNVEGFDECFAGWGLEDTELHYRLARAGAGTRVAREAYNYHQNHPKNVAAQRAEWAANAKVFLRKHETLEVALYVHAETGNLRHLDACEIMSEAQRLGECSLVRVLRQLIIDSAFAIVSRAAWGSHG
jgi:glycosyltransferase involved in cell wall biosynthesis